MKRGRSSNDRRESVARITDKGLALLVSVDLSVSKEERPIGNCLRSREMEHPRATLPATLPFGKRSLLSYPFKFAFVARLMLFLKLSNN